MLEHGFPARSCFWNAIGFLLFTGAFCPQFILAQPVKQIVPPAPLGSPYLPPGPISNPFGPPPMPIGPAPSPIFVGPPPPPYAARPSFAAPYGYPPPGYPGVPYMVRRATPFDATGPMIGSAQTPTLAAPQVPNLLAPQPVESQTVIDRGGAIALVSTPASIGNLRLTVSENLLNRIVAKDEQKPGDIQDFILGAQVTGRQITDTKVRLDLLPSSDKARGAIVLNGVTQSQTTGVTPQAMVDTASQQQFRAIKEVFFDGMKFSTRHAVVYARAQNQTMGAQTPLTGTLLGGIANRIAFRAAEKRQAEGEAIARDRVAERVFPEFDNGIDKRLAAANDQLEERLRPILRRTNFMPSTQQLISTDTYLRYSIQLGDDTPTTSADALDVQLIKDDGANLMIHETLLNYLVHRSGLKGLKTTDQEVRAMLAPYEIKALPGDPDAPAVSMPGMENVVTNIEFDETDPLTIKLEQDKAVVTMRASFKPAGQQVLPPLAVTIEYKTDVEGEKLVVTPGNVHVAALKDEDKNATTAFALKLISQVIQSSLSKLAIDRNLPATMWPFGGPVPRITGVRSQDGWAAVTIN